MRKVKHNKIRNTGLLFEFLLRQITSDVLNKDQNSKAVTIVKQKFNENTELGKELALYNILITKKFKSDSKADYFINEVMKTRSDLNNSILRREKYNLIKEIQSNYNLQKFMSSKVPNYKTYASIYKLFEYNTLSPDEKTESFFNIVEHVTTKDNNVRLSETVKALPDDEGYWDNNETDLVTNGDFSSGTGWSGSASISGGQLTKTSAGLAYQVISGLQAGNEYIVVVDVETVGSANQVYLGGTNSSNLVAGIQTINIIAGSSNTFLGFNNGSTSTVINSISLVSNDIFPLDV